MNRLVMAGLSVLCASTACVIGAPPGFSDGDVWTFPLVGPLDDGLLLTPVSIDGTGPYLFMIDPDSPRSSIDQGIANTLKLRSGYGLQQIDENDHSQPVRLADVRTIKVGNLTVTQRKLRIHKVDTFWAAGRRVRGILGRDVIADTLMFAVDRDRGVATLATKGKLPVPADAAVVSFGNIACRVCTDTSAGIESDRVTRRLAPVTLNSSHELTLHLDLGGQVSMLWPGKLQQLKMPRLPVDVDLVDELGSHRKVDHGSIAAKLSVAGLEENGLLILPFGDKRWEETDLDGSLGQNFLSSYRVTVSWNKRKLWLKRRDPRDVVARLGERLSRWGSMFDACKAPACVTIEARRLAPAGDADDRARKLYITREPALVDETYEILFEALDASGKPLALPRLTATLPAGVASVVEPQLAAGYADAARFRVLDASPFGRDCQPVGQGYRCVWDAFVKR